MLLVALISPVVPEAAVPTPNESNCTSSSVSSVNSLRCEPAPVTADAAKNVRACEGKSYTPAVPEPVK